MGIVNSKVDVFLVSCEFRKHGGPDCLPSGKTGSQQPFSLWIIRIHPMDFQHRNPQPDLAALPHFASQELGYTV